MKLCENGLIFICLVRLYFWKENGNVLNYKYEICDRF